MLHELVEHYDHGQESSRTVMYCSRPFGSTSAELWNNLPSLQARTQKPFSLRFSVVKRYFILLLLRLSTSLPSFPPI